MKTFRIANTDIDASRISFGCMTIGGSWDNQPPDEPTVRNAMKVVRAALDGGINFFDHADIYTRGKSEIVFSNLWQESPGIRSRIYVQSKCGIRFKGDPNLDDPQRFDFSYEHIISSAENSLKRLKTDYLDILLLHRPDPLVQPEEVAKAFDELQKSGKVRYFGVSNHTGMQIDLLKKYVTQPLVVNQMEISILHSVLFEAGIVTNQTNPDRQIRGEGTLEYCRLNDITVQAWSPLAKGYLTGRQPENPPERIIKTAKLVQEIASEKNVSTEAVALAWLLRHPAGIQPVVGTTKAERISACCQADNIELSRNEWYSLFIEGRGAPLP